MPYPYLGTSELTYPQYLDDDTGHPLQAQPGGVYSMTPVQGAHMPPVPPGDGMWGAETPVKAAGKTTTVSKAAPDAAAEGD